jgi:RNA polymerase sigma-70 factor (ECF subfamily)
VLDEIRGLVRRCLGGEQAAMAELVDRIHGKVYGLCYRMLGQRQDAEDVVQETCFRVLRSLARWDPGRDFEPWVMAIAGNRCRTALVARQRRTTGRLLEDSVIDSAPPREQLDQLREEVDLALSNLRPEYRQAFVLFHDEQLAYEEIADRMAVPLGTVKTWVHRARKELMVQLQCRGVGGERGKESAVP